MFPISVAIEKSVRRLIVELVAMLLLLSLVLLLAPQSDPSRSARLRLVRPLVCK